MPKTSDEYYGALSVEELEEIIKQGSTTMKTAARTELKEREAQILLEKEELKKKEAREALKEEEKKETKKQQMRRVLEKTNQSMSIKAFAKFTGMKESTARRELGQATNPKSKHFTKDIVRVGKKGSKGVKYRFK
jgi:Fic family protein